MMKKLSLLLFLILSSTASFAQMDYKVENLLRTYPSALYVKGIAGYSIPLYGEGEKVLFGYLRPSISLKSAVVVNSGKFQLDFNPISIVNFYYAKSYTQRNYEKFSNFDCSTLICTANIKRDHYGMRIALKYKKIFYSGALNYFSGELDQDNKGDWADELSSLVNTGSKSVLVQQLHLLGYELSETLSLGYLGLYNKMNNNLQKSSMHIAFGRYQFNKEWNLLSGIGIFKTRVQKTNLTAIGILSWIPKKGLPLF